jgi:predicted ArsR family transcriptional regulator
MQEVSTDAYARTLHPETSHAAARSVRPTDLEACVLRALRSCKDGATSFELAELLGLSLVTVSPRLRPLVNKRLVRDSGRTRRGDSGRPRIVWEIATPRQEALPF